jgi:hypothetical protein
VIVVLRFRVAIALAGGAGVRVIQWASGPGLDTPFRIGGALAERLQNPGESDEDLEAALSDAGASLPAVATFSGSFEVRRLQASFTMDSGVVGGEDVRVVTFHLIKLSGASPVATWDAGDFTAARDAFLAFWSGIGANYNNTFKLTRTAFYRAGPGIEPPQPPANSADHNLAGALSGVNMLPPQVAISVMERHGGSRKNHGRFFLPGPNTGFSNTFGRPASSFLAEWADHVDTLYQAWKTANLPAVVYLPELPARSPGATDPRYVTVGTFPPRSASARTVDEIVIDNTFDVIRSRRYDRSTNRQARDIS